MGTQIEYENLNLKNRMNPIHTNYSLKECRFKMELKNEELKHKLFPKILEIKLDEKSL